MMLLSSLLLSCGKLFLINIKYEATCQKLLDVITSQAASALPDKLWKLSSSSVKTQKHRVARFIQTDANVFPVPAACNGSNSCRGGDKPGTRLGQKVRIQAVSMYDIGIPMSKFKCGKCCSLLCNYRLVGSSWLGPGHHNSL